jgi:hypothetical protein
MSWAGKLRPQAAAAAAGAQTKPTVVQTGSGSGTVRVSNGLKEFLWLLSDIPSARILDLGPASQANLNFFLQKGFRISTEDMLRSWKEFLGAEEERLRLNPVGEAAEELSATALAGRFLEGSLNYPEQSVNGILAWDLLDYFDATVIPQFLERIYRMMRPGGAMLCLFHSKPPATFHRYRILEGNNLEQIPSPTLAVHAHVFQNREIQDLFRAFRSSKTFVSRDQVREVLFLK